MSSENIHFVTTIRNVLLTANTLSEYDAIRTHLCAACGMYFHAPREERFRGTRDPEPRHLMWNAWGLRTAVFSPFTASSSFRYRGGGTPLDVMCYEVPTTNTTTTATWGSPRDTSREKEACTITSQQQQLGRQGKGHQLLKLNLLDGMATIFDSVVCRGFVKATDGVLIVLDIFGDTTVTAATEEEEQKEVEEWDNAAAGSSDVFGSGCLTQRCVKTLQLCAQQGHVPLLFLSGFDRLHRVVPRSALGSVAARIQKILRVVQDIFDGFFFSGEKTEKRTGDHSPNVGGTHSQEDSATGSSSICVLFGSAQDGWGCSVDVDPGSSSEFQRHFLEPVWDRYNDSARKRQEEQQQQQQQQQAVGGAEHDAQSPSPIDEAEDAAVAFKRLYPLVDVLQEMFYRQVPPPFTPRNKKTAGQCCKKKEACSEDSCNNNDDDRAVVALHVAALCDTAWDDLDSEVAICQVLTAQQESNSSSGGALVSLETRASLEWKVDPSAQTRRHSPLPPVLHTTTRLYPFTGKYLRGRLPQSAPSHHHKLVEYQQPEEGQILALVGDIVLMETEMPFHIEYQKKMELKQEKTKGGTSTSQKRQEKISLNVERCVLYDGVTFVLKNHSDPSAHHLLFVGCRILDDNLQMEQPALLLRDVLPSLQSSTNPELTSSSCSSCFSVPRWPERPLPILSKVIDIGLVALAEQFEQVARIRGFVNSSSVFLRVILSRISSHQNEPAEGAEPVHAAELRDANTTSSSRSTRSDHVPMCSVELPFSIDWESRDGSCSDMYLMVKGNRFQDVECGVAFVLAFLPYGRNKNNEKKPISVSELRLHPRRTISRASSSPVIASSPNRHNRLQVRVRPLPTKLRDALICPNNAASTAESLHNIAEGSRSNQREQARFLAEDFGVNEVEFRKFVCFLPFRLDMYSRMGAFMGGSGADSLSFPTPTNVLLNCIEGPCGHDDLIELKESIVSGFNTHFFSEIDDNDTRDSGGGGSTTTRVGMLCGVQVELCHITKHADAIHRAGGQIIPTARQALQLALDDVRPHVILWPRYHQVTIRLALLKGHNVKSTLLVDALISFLADEMHCKNIVTQQRRGTGCWDAFLISASHVPCTLEAELVNLFSRQPTNCLRDVGGDTCVGRRSRSSLYENQHLLSVDSSSVQPAFDWEATIAENEKEQ